MTSSDQAKRSPGGSTERASGPAAARPIPGRGGHADEVARRIEGYTPRGIPALEWDRLRPLVVPALHRSMPVGLAAMERYARVLTWIASWCLRASAPPTA